MKKEVVILLRSISITFCLLSAYVGFGQTAAIDSLNNIANSQAHDSVKIKALNKISELLINSEPQRALQVNAKALALSIEKKLPSEEALSSTTRVILHYRLNNLDSSKFYCLKAIDLYKNLNLPIELGKSYNMIGSVNQELGNYGPALQAYSEALEIFKAIPYPSGIAASLNRIGNFYTKREEYETSIRYYSEALEIFRKLNRYDQISNGLNNIGVGHFQLKDYNKALEYFISSLQILKENQLKSQIPIRELNIGKTYTELREYQLADKYLKQALVHSEEAHNHQMICYSLLHLGILKKVQHLNVAADKYLIRGLMLASRYSFKDLELQYHETMASNFAEHGNYEEAYKHYQQFSLLKDSLVTIEKNREMLLMQNQFEAKQHEQQISLLQHQAEKKNIILYALIIGAALLALSLVLILINYNSKQRSMKLIHQQKEEISRQKITDLLKDQELSSIKNKLEGQENERKRIAQELHDGIGGTMASIKLNLLKIAKDEGELKLQLNDVIQRLDDACEEVRTVSHNLIPPVFYNSALTDVIEDFINKTVNSKSININYEFYPKRQLETIDKNIQIDIYRIIQELVTNVIKHANASEINIYLTKHDDYINLMVEDDGIGLKNEKRQEGIGLKNIRSRVRALNGTITFDSKPGNGTTVIIDISLTDEKSSQMSKIGMPENRDF